jgi:hypothetical protein
MYVSMQMNNFFPSSMLLCKCPQLAQISLFRWPIKFFAMQITYCHDESDLVRAIREASQSDRPWLVTEE